MELLLKGCTYITSISVLNTERTLTTSLEILLCPTAIIETHTHTPVKRGHTFNDMETTLKEDKCSVLNTTIASK